MAKCAVGLNIFQHRKISTIQFKPITFDLELLKYVFNDDHKYGSMWRAKYLMVNQLEKEEEEEVALDRTKTMIILPN